MNEPLAHWDDDYAQSPQLVWWTRLDGRFQIEIHRDDDDTAHMHLFDKEDNFQDVLDDPIPLTLSYGARFGPDIDDIMKWQEIAVKIVDGLKAP